MATMDSKYIQHLRKISAVLLRLISRTLKLFPFGLVIVPVILFYFAPDSFLAEIIHEWKNADISETSDTCQIISEGDIYMCVCGCFSQLSFFLMSSCL
uniref:Conjugative transfer protein n=1 Tax=Escherichia coli TaxID=562 RepID=A0A5P1MT42_ECOLX|nr:hypothetical protein p13ZX36-70_00046 [Escherichia coli]